MILDLLSHPAVHGILSIMMVILALLPLVL